MFTRIDHVVIAVPDLPRAIDQYHKLGFNVHPGGAHPGMGTHNAVALNQDDYLELLAIRDQAEQKAAAARPGSWVAGMADFIAAGGGIRYVVLQSDDLTTDVAAMRSRGVAVSDAMDGSRLTSAGKELRWKLALLGPKNPLPIFFIQHSTPMAERRKQVPDAANQTNPSPSVPRLLMKEGNNALAVPLQTMKDERLHPNGVYALERAYIVTEDVERAAATYAKVLGLPQPPITPGTVIMSNMAVFQIGAMGLSIAQPYAPGAAADALERRGPGPFQALYRTTSMDAAARWIKEHALPPLARGVRNTGEHAMLATPAEACGTYLGFVGPE
jgi:catechol 2,3-dioxygenase-like lactoylglutathione lyase family enzyme